METERLLILPMREDDESAFAAGISDRTLRAAYGFPEEMDDSIPPKIFRHFRSLPGGYSLIGKETGKMIGFLLDTEPELPEKTAETLSANGRTLAFAVYPPYQRRGYMQEALEAYTRSLFSTGTGYIHCGHYTDNEPSRQLLRKLGFREYARHIFMNRTIVDEILTGRGE